MRLETLIETRERSARLAEMKEIFFQSASESNRNADEIARERFWQRWTSYYIQNCADEVIFAIENRRAIGYLTGCDDSRAASATLGSSIKSYSLFEDHFDSYPAHLHMNVHPNARGKGVGAALIENYADGLKARDVCGVHIVTVPGERNVDFYLRHGFRAIEERAYNGQALVLMGRRLEASG